MIVTYDDNGNQIKKADSYESEEKSDTLILGIYGIIIRGQEDL